MDALEYRIKQALMAVAEDAFRKEKIPDFLVTIDTSDRKSFHGMYYPLKRIIRIGNMTRPVRQVIMTSIHELAHHCQYSFYKTCGHSDDFYSVFHALLVSAARLGIVDADLINGGFTNSPSSMKVFRKYGYISQQCVPRLRYMKDFVLVSAFSSYSVRDKLKARRYIFNSRAHSWEKTLPKEESEKEEAFIRSIGAVPVVTGVLDISLDASVTVSGLTYGIKDTLKERGYHFDKAVSAWKKRVPAGDVPKEKEYLYLMTHNAQISVDIWY